MPKLFSVGENARRYCNVRPAQITALFYERRLADDKCPLIGGRRAIPEDYIPVIEMELRRKGVDPKLAKASAWTA